MKKALTFAGIVGLMAWLLVYLTQPDTIKPGTTVNDPGKRIYHYLHIIDDVSPVVVPVNWHEIAQTDRPSEWFLSSGLNQCDRQTGAKMTALEQFEDEVLVKYTNPKREGRYSCPSNVKFWIFVNEFRDAESDYQKIIKDKFEKEERMRKANEKQPKKEEAARRHVKPRS